MNTANTKTDEDTLAMWQRAAESFFVAGMFALFGFLVYHQSTNTGFFTERFGSTEMFWLYGPLLFGTSAPIIRAWIGRRNPARPFEAATSVLLALGALWLVSVFPFNYAHLADVLPVNIRPFLAWVNDDFGRVVLIVQAVIGPISALTTMLKYFSVRQRESEPYLRQRTL